MTGGISTSGRSSTTFIGAGASAEVPRHMQSEYDSVAHWCVFQQCFQRSAAHRRYSLGRSSVEFASYMRGEGFSIIPISAKDQLQYACNVLNLGDSRIISVHAGSARQIVKSDCFKGDVRVIDFSHITSMYGSVHCASQVRVQRRLVVVVCGLTACCRLLPRHSCVLVCIHARACTVEYISRWEQVVLVEYCSSIVGWDVRGSTAHAQARHHVIWILLYDCIVLAGGPPHPQACSQASGGSGGERRQGKWCQRPPCMSELMGGAVPTAGQQRTSQQRSDCLFMKCRVPFYVLFCLVLSPCCVAGVSRALAWT